MENVLDIKQLRSVSNESRKKKSSNREEKYKKACDEAFVKVIENCKEKMLESAKLGYYSSCIYEWSYIKGKATEEQLSVSRFNDVWLLDIITKGNLLNRLTEFFNNGVGDEDDIQYRVNYRKRKNVYGLYVSWGDSNYSHKKNESTQRD